MICGDLNQQVGGHGVTVHKATTFACWGRVNKKKDMSKVGMVKNIMEDATQFEGAQTMQMGGIPTKIPLFGLVKLNTPVIIIIALQASKTILSAERAEIK